MLPFPAAAPDSDPPQKLLSPLTIHACQQGSLLSFQAGNLFHILANCV